MDFKRALRIEMKQVLGKLSHAEKARQSEIIQKKILSHPKYLNAKRISIYLSLKSEVDTSLILNQMFNDKKQCFVPRYKNGTKDMQMIELESLKEYETLPETNWGIKQFPDDSSKEDALKTGGLDLILLPGFAFDSNGGRLGKGGGFYDKYLSDIKQHYPNNMPYLIGLAFKEQIKDGIPMTDRDFRVSGYFIAQK